MMRPDIIKDYKARFSLLRSLPMHMLLQPSTWNLLFIKYDVRYLKSNREAVNEKLGESWQIVYNLEHSDGKSYDLLKSIGGNPTFVSVYEFEEKKVQTTPQKKEKLEVQKKVEKEPRYENSGVGALTLLGNIVMHANENRMRNNLPTWTDEQLEALIEHDLPGEMLHAFTFFWLIGLPIDFGNTPCA